MPYATPKQIKQFTGVTPSWLRLDDEAALDAWLEEWVGKAEEQIDEYTNDSWTDADLPGTVNTAAIRFVANAIKAARRHRAEQVMRVDDLTGGQALRPLTPPDAFLTDPIRRDLDPYVKRKASSTLRGFRVSSRSERAAL